MFRITPNIIKRTFSHHHSPTNFPVSSFINHFDRKTMEETNKNVHELVSKTNHINTRVNTIFEEVDFLHNIIILNFIITNTIGLSILLIHY